MKKALRLGQALPGFVAGVSFAGSRATVLLHRRPGRELGVHHHARPNLLDSLDDNLLASLQSRIDNQFPGIGLPSLVMRSDL